MWAVAAWLGSVADWAITSYALSNGYTEANPLMVFVAEDPVTFFIVKVVWAAVALLFLAGRQSLDILRIVACVMAFVVVWNVFALAASV